MFVFSLKTGVSTQKTDPRIPGGNSLGREMNSSAELIDLGSTIKYMFGVGFPKSGRSMVSKKCESPDLPYRKWNSKHGKVDISHPPQSQDLGGQSGEK